jgi:hypothetical protein
METSHDIARDLRNCWDRETQDILTREFWAAVEAERATDIDATNSAPGSASMPSDDEVPF